MCILTLFDHLPLPVRRAARTFIRLLRSGEASAMLAVLLTLLATLFPSAFPALAENGLSWSWDSEDNALYISGSGTIDQSFWNDSNLPPKGNISYVSIGEGITAIGSNTFSGCESLAEVWIHWTGTPLTLGPGAFDGTPVINTGVRINNNSSYPDALLLIDPQNSGYRYTTGEEVNFWLISTGTTASAVLKLAYTVTYDGNGGEISEGLKTQVSYPYASGSETKVLANQFNRIGYSFAGWNTSPNGGGTGYNAEEPITVDKDITLYAQWTPNTYTVRYDANGGTGSMAEQNFIWGTQQNLTANTFTRIGYTFTKWNTEPNGIGTSYTDGRLIGDLSSELDNVVTLYAQWTPNTYTVRFDANGGTGSMADQEFTYDEAQKLKAIAYTQTGFSFEGWNTNKDGSGTFYKDQDEVSNLSTGGNVTLFAQWTPYSQATTCNVKVTSSGNGDAYANVTSGNTWDVVKLTAIPAEGYFFSTWEVISGGVVVTNNQFNIGTSDVEINAIFSQQRTYKVTVLTEGWGVVRVKPPKDYFNSGEVVELFPDATEDWEFAEWRGAKVTKNQFTVGTSDVWITAVFRRRQTNKLRTDFIYVLADGNKGIPPDINAALWEDLTIQLQDKDNNTVAESKYFTLDIKSEDPYTVTMEDLEYYGSLTEQDLAPGKYTVSISELPETMDDKWGNPNPGRPRYKIESEAEINEKDGSMVVTVYIFFYDNPEIIVDAPKPQPGLPEDSTGAYYFDEDGIKKYALYQTYLDCMRGLGQDELCRSHERCYHK